MGNKSTIEVVSTAHFWDLMCDPRSLRVSHLSIARAGAVYVTLEAPEDVAGFIDARIDAARAALE